MIRFPPLFRISAATLLLSWAHFAVAQTNQTRTSVSTWPGADLFTDGEVIRLQIDIEPSGLDQLGQNPRGFVKAQVSQAGVQYSDVAVHLKGSIGSFRPLSDKPGFTLDFSVFHSGQRFHALRRIHLNNSVEDPTYCNEQLGSELFRSAGIPAPRVTRALVKLNHRELGVYVLKEGFTENFLSCYFKKIGGNLFEPGEGHDVNQHLKRTSIPAPAQNRAALHKLSEAVQEPDPVVRWERLERTLELDRFVRFMAMEVMIGHRDGYCLARNNFRLYQDLDTEKMVFLPQGMDQLFGTAQIPWKPHMAGLAARAVLETVHGDEQYHSAFRTLFDSLFHPDVLTNRVNEIIRPLRSCLSETEFRSIQTEASALNDRILQRWAYLKDALNRPSPRLLAFKDGLARLSGWTKVDAPKNGQMDKGPGPGQRACMHIQTGSETSASWRTKALLESGSYQFKGYACVQNVKPLGFGAHQGAGLRITGQVRQAPNLVGSSGWRELTTEFQVTGGPQEVELVCELRAGSGEVWFDEDSLQLIHQGP